jgi:hypothetical protein
MNDAPCTPLRFRFALLVVIGIYRLITAMLHGLAPLTFGWAVWQRTLLIAPLMVAAITRGIIGLYSSCAMRPERAARMNIRRAYLWN